MIIKRLLIFAAIVLATVLQAQSQPNVPTLQVDTLCNLGKTIPGEASGAYFLPDGNIIAVIRDTPLIVDSKSGEILRRLDSLIGQDVQCPKVSPDGRYLIAFTYKGTAVWDILSGKILKFIGNTTDYCFSPDGTKLYVIGGNPNSFGAVRIYDMNTLEEVERFCSATGGIWMDISPDGNSLVVSVQKKPNASNDKKTSQLILVNLNDKKNYTAVETLQSQIYFMEFSPDGKQIAFLYNDGNNDHYIYIYNLVTKEKKYIREQELETLFGYPSLLSGHPKFISSTTLSFVFSKYTLVWNTEDNQLKKLIKFLPWSISSYNDTLILCTQNGLIGFLNKNIVPVKENEIPNESYLKYNNNQLEYFSAKFFVGEAKIYDISGKQIADIGKKSFIFGKNTIPINQVLPVGVYILTINGGTEQISQKFIVE